MTETACPALPTPTPRLTSMFALIWFPAVGNIPLELRKRFRVVTRAVVNEGVKTSRPSSPCRDVQPTSTARSAEQRSVSQGHLLTPGCQVRQGDREWPPVPPAGVRCVSRWLPLKLNFSS